MVKISIKRRFWFGWRVLLCRDYQWLCGRTAGAGLEFVPDEAGGQVKTKLADVPFPLQLVVTLEDGTLEYIPNIAKYRLRIHSEVNHGLQNSE